MERNQWMRDGFTIRDKEHYSQSMGKLCMTDTYSDLILISRDESRFPAHRDILAARSDYFSALLYGGLKESGEKEVTVECSDEVLKIILTFLYSGEVVIGSSQVSLLMTLLSETRRMVISNLQAALEDLLLEQFKNGDLKDAIKVFNFAEDTDFGNIAKPIRKYLEENIDIILSCEDLIKSFSVGSLKTFLSGADLDVPEIEIFRGIAQWINTAEANRINAAEPNLYTWARNHVLSAVRLDQVTIKQLVGEVRSSGLFSDSDILEAVSLNESKVNSVNSRKVLINQNICLSSLGAKVIKAESERFLSNTPIRINEVIIGKRNGYDYNKNKMYVQSELGKRIEIELASKQKINKINILLHDRECVSRTNDRAMTKVDKEYSYKVESSLDGIRWEVVADFSDYKGKSWQTIYFDEKRMKYIGIVGTKEFRTEQRIFRSDEPLSFLETYKDHIHIIAVEAQLDTNTDDKDRKNSGMVKI